MHRSRPLRFLLYYGLNGRGCFVRFLENRVRGEKVIGESPVQRDPPHRYFQSDITFDNKMDLFPDVDRVQETTAIVKDLAGPLSVDQDHPSSQTSPLLPCNDQEDTSLSCCHRS